MCLSSNRAGIFLVHQVIVVVFHSCLCCIVIIYLEKKGLAVAEDPMRIERHSQWYGKPLPYRWVAMAVEEEEMMGG